MSRHQFVVSGRLASPLHAIGLSRSVLTMARYPQSDPDGVPAGVPHR